MRLVLFGAPGSGKGTQGPFLAERCGIPQVSTGEILRENLRQGTELGRKAEQYMTAGDLVPDQVIIGIIRDRIGRPDASGGFVLDGFPRTLPQAEALDQMLEDVGAPVDRVLYLRVPQATLERRLGGRWTCPECGTVYSEAVPPGTEGRCDVEGAALEQREDDRPEAVHRRIQVYLDQTMPVLEYYRAQGKVLELDGVRSVEEIRADLEQRLREGPGARTISHDAVQRA